MPESTETRTARQGKKMIEVRVRFWTNGLAEGTNKVRPKHAWASGVVLMATNETHGIKPMNPRPFNSFTDMLPVVEKVLIEHGVKLHETRRLQKLMARD